MLKPATRRSVATAYLKQQTTAITQIHADWQVCLDVEEMVDDFGALMIAKLNAGERMTHKQYAVLDRANSILSQQMACVADRFKAWELS